MTSATTMTLGGFLDASARADSAATARVDEDADLAAQAARGDARAFTLLVRRFQGRVFGVAVRMLGDPHEAEDVAQEVFVALHGALGTFRAESRLSTWIYRITRNHCLNRLKYMSRRGRRLMGPQAHSPDETEDPVERVRSEQPNPAQVVSAQQDGVRLEAALRKVSQEHRLLIILRDVEQLSYDEIADVTGLPEGTIKSRLHRARAALLDLMPDMGAGQP